MLVHFATDDIGVELCNEACWAVILDDLNDALLDVLISDDLFFKVSGVQPFDLCYLSSVL